MNNFAEKNIYDAKNDGLINFFEYRNEKYITINEMASLLNYGDKYNRPGVVATIKNTLIRNKIEWIKVKRSNLNKNILDFLNVNEYVNIFSLISLKNVIRFIDEVKINAKCNYNRIKNEILNILGENKNMNGKLKIYDFFNEKYLLYSDVINLFKLKSRNSLRYRLNKDNINCLVLKATELRSYGIIFDGKTRKVFIPIEKFLKHLENNTEFYSDYKNILHDLSYLYNYIEPVPEEEPDKEITKEKKYENITIYECEKENNKSDESNINNDDDSNELLEKYLKKFLLDESLEYEKDFRFCIYSEGYFNPFLENIDFFIDGESFYNYLKNEIPTLTKEQLIKDMIKIDFVNDYHGRYENGIDEFCINFNNYRFKNDFKLSITIKYYYDSIINDEIYEYLQCNNIKEILGDDFINSIISNYLTVDMIKNSLDKSKLEELYIHLDDEFKTPVNEELKVIHDYDTEMYNKLIVPDKEVYIFSDKYKIGDNIKITDKTSDISQLLTVLNNHGSKLETFVIDTKTENLKGKERIQIRQVEVKEFFDKDLEIVKL